jgi:pimeloyl-ACP methyl ester carboxylesterase
MGQLHGAWPVAVESIGLVGHSMGGLVARSAAHRGGERGAAWVPRLGTLVTLGSPHLGAPLEKAVHVGDRALRAVPETAALARPLATRSLGIKDLRYGAIVEADWSGHDPDELLCDRCTDPAPLPHVAHHWLGTTVTTDPGHPAGWLLGDGMVRAASAAGPARGGEGRRLRGSVASGGASGRTPPAETALLGGITHLRQVHDPGIYPLLARWLTEPTRSPSPPLSRPAAEPAQR